MSSYEDYGLTHGDVKTLNASGVTTHFIISACRTLLANSVNKEVFKEAVAEWQFKAYYDGLTPTSICELCGKTGLRHEFQIRNKLTGRWMLIGSECITSFDAVTALVGTGILDESGQRIDKTYVKTVVKQAGINFVVEAIELNMRPGGFRDSIVKAIQDEKGLSPKQLKTVRFIYEGVSTDGQMKMRHGIKVRLSKKSFKSDAVDILSHDEYTWAFIKIFMTAKQIETIAAEYYNEY